MKISMELPKILSFDDYHEIGDFADRFNELTGGKPKLKFDEIIGTSDYGYKALFYFGGKDKAYKAIRKAYEKSVKENDGES